MYQICDWSSYPDWGAHPLPRAGGFLKGDVPKGDSNQQSSELHYDNSYCPAKSVYLKYCCSSPQQLQEYSHLGDEGADKVKKEHIYMFLLAKCDHMITYKTLLTEQEWNHIGSLYDTISVDLLSDYCEPKLFYCRVHLSSIQSH